MLSDICLKRQSQALDKYTDFRSAGAVSPYLERGIGIALMDQPQFSEGDSVQIRCIDGELHDGELASLPFYDKDCEIPRGKKVEF